MLPCMQRHSSEVARLYQTEFIRSARAVGMLWAICTLCFAIIEVVILIQPSWVGTRELHYRGGGPAPPTGTLGLFEVCMEMDWPVPECRGSLRTLTPLSAFQSPAVLVCMSLTMVWASVGCLCLFRFCNAATVYKICAWLQLTAGETLQLTPQVSSAHHERLCKEEWSKIPLSVFSNLVKCYRRRLRAVLLAKGGCTKY
uniref:LHFPL tetraspan subfamily member 4b n=1 Tax=Cyprinus carpio TaxID=7962 RepID=A0A8C2BPC4_CYPCA